MEGKLTGLDDRGRRAGGGGGGERRPGGGGDDGERRVLAAAAATGRGGLAAVAVREGHGSRRWRRWRATVDGALTTRVEN